MGWGAGRKLLDVVANTEHVLAVELLCAARGMEYRAPLRPAAATAAALAAIREVVPPLTDDRPIGAEIEAVATLIGAGRFDAY